MLLSFPVKIKIDSIEIALQIASTRPDNEILETDTPYLQRLFLPRLTG